MVGAVRCQGERRSCLLPHKSTTLSNLVDSSPSVRNSRGHAEVNQNSVFLRGAIVHRARAKASLHQTFWTLGTSICARHTGCMHRARDVLSRNRAPWSHRSDGHSPPHLDLTSIALPRYGREKQCIERAPPYRQLMMRVSAS